MRNAWRAILVVVAALLPWTVLAEPYVTARGAIIVDADSGAVIWEQNPDEELPPASTTKVMTAILALQSHQLDEHFVVSDYAAATPPSKIGFRPGQTVALRDLLYAVLLKSANDAAVVVAEGVAGSESSFAQRMNLKARVIGASYTNFMNPHGLTEYGHETTARDLSRIFRYGLGVPGFREVLSTPAAEVPIDGPSARLALVRSHNRLLNAPDFQVIGKTGYTRPARRCFVGAAGHGSREVVIAILGSNDLWGDARRMLDYGLGAGRPAPVLQMASAPLPAAAQTAGEPQPAFARAAAPEPTATATAAALEKRPESPPRAVPSPEPVPVEIARAETDRAPEAAVARAARMARAQSAEPLEPEPARLDDEEPPTRAHIDDADAREREEQPNRPAAAPPPPEPRIVAAPPAAEEPVRQRMIDEPVRAQVVDEPAREEPGHEPAAVAQNDLAPAGEDDAAEPARPAQAREPEQPRGGIWADSPLRSPGEPATVRPARAVEQKPVREEPDAVADQPQRRAKSSRQLAAETRHKGRASRSDDDDDDRPGSVASARTTAGPSRRPNSSREERADRRHSVVLARAVGQDTRSSRSIRRAVAVEDERDQPSKRTRSGRGRSAGDDEDESRASRRTAKDQGKYTVQLGPYRDKKSVAVARTDLARRGYEARVVGQKLELGNFADRSRADKLASRLRVNGHRATSAEVR